ncbi:MAG: hypothetical protein Q7R70_02525, partial [Candidatus Diapherotrites archaeon]|nr:hypothetical protein [Candidatus Diapherotrites archaeon]
MKKRISPTTAILISIILLIAIIGFSIFLYNILGKIVYFFAMLIITLILSIATISKFENKAT